MSTELLQGILDQLKAQNGGAKLGFGDPPRARYIYANRQYPDCLWYFWNGGKSVYEPIESHALTGFIEKIEIEEKEFRGKADPKVNLHIRADRPYVIQSGFDTLFARGLLFALTTLPPETFQQPITIAVEAGDTEQVLFCKVYNPVTGVSVYAPYPDDVNWTSIANQAIALVSKSVPITSEQPLVEAPPRVVLPARLHYADPQGVVLAEDLPLPMTSPPPVKKNLDKRPLASTPVQTRIPEVDRALEVLPDGPPAGIVDEVRSNLRQAKTLRDFTHLKQTITIHSETLGLEVSSMLRQNVEAAYSKAFPKDVLEGATTLIKDLKDKLQWSPQDFQAFLTSKFPGCETSAHLTLSQILSLAQALRDENNHRLAHGSSMQEFDEIPF